MYVVVGWFEHINTPGKPLRPSERTYLNVAAALTVL
jgi:hypothetical protein